MSLPDGSISKAELKGWSGSLNILEAFLLRSKLYRPDSCVISANHFAGHVYKIGEFFFFFNEERCCSKLQSFMTVCFLVIPYKPFLDLEEITI